MMTVLRWLPRFRASYRALDELATRENWGRVAIESYQLDRINRLWLHAIRHVPHYRNLAAKANLPQEFQSLDEFRNGVPCLPKQTVRNHTRTIVSERAETGFWRRTGGSTGAPMRLFMGRTAHREMLQARYRFYATWGLDIFDRFVFLWGHGASFAPGWAGLSARLRQPIIDWTRNRRRLSAYHLDRDTLRRYLRRIDRCGPAALYGYASAIYLLAREAIDLGFHSDTLRATILTSEPTFPHMADTVRHAFSAPAVIEYGAAECALIAGQADDGTLRVREDMVLLETLPRGDGSHDIACTVLNNPSFPLIRYLIGDVTPAPLKFVDRGFAVLQSVEGRCNDCLQSRDGDLIHPGYLIEWVKQSGDVGRYQIWQRGDGSVEVALESQGTMLKLDRAGLIRRLQDAFGGYAVELDIVNVLPQTVAGKHRWIRSELTAQTRVQQH